MAWWDKDWQYRRKIVFDTTSTGANIKANLDEVPVLLRLDTGNFSFDQTKNDGSDIRFIDGDDKVPLKFQREVYDPADEIALFWVMVPRVMAESKQNFIWVYYGNKSAPDAQEAGWCLRCRPGPCLSSRRRRRKTQGRDGLQEQPVGFFRRPGRDRE